MLLRKEIFITSEYPEGGKPTPEFIPIHRGGKL